MLRVLQAVTCMDRGGLETMLMNYYRHIDRTRVQFDFLTHRAREGAYDKEIYSLGGKVFTVPRQNPFSPAYRHALHKFSPPTRRILLCTPILIVFPALYSVAPSSTACLYALLTHTPQISCTTSNIQ